MHTTPSTVSSASTLQQQLSALPLTERSSLQWEFLPSPWNQDDRTNEDPSEADSRKKQEESLGTYKLQNTEYSEHYGLRKPESLVQLQTRLSWYCTCTSGVYTCYYGTSHWRVQWLGIRLSSCYPVLPSFSAPPSSVSRFPPTKQLQHTSKNDRWEGSHSPTDTQCHGL